jgi:RNA polymerase sigma-70 factor (ECF subfamily)
MKIVKQFVAALSIKQALATRRKRLYQTAYSWCHDPALADDLVRETMYKAIKNSSSLREIATLDTWLYRILINCWHDYLRVSGRHVELFDISDDRIGEHSDMYQKVQIVDRVRASVANLPMNLREVVTLADFAGFSYAEIASIIDVPVGTVMSRLYRARQNLKEQLLDMTNDENIQFKLRSVK